MKRRSIPKTRGGLDTLVAISVGAIALMVVLLAVIGIATAAGYVPQ